MSSVYCVIESGLWEEHGGEFEEEGTFLGAFSSEAGARSAIDVAVAEKRCEGERGRYRYLAFMSALDAPVRMDSYFVWSYHTISEAEPRPFEVVYEYDPKWKLPAHPAPPSFPPLELFAGAREWAAALPI